MQVYLIVPSSDEEQQATTYTYTMPKDGWRLRSMAERWIQEQFEIENARPDPIKRILNGSKTEVYYECPRCGWRSDHWTGLTDPVYAGKKHEAVCARAAELGLTIGMDSYNEIYSIRVAGTNFQIETYGSCKGSKWVPYATWEDCPASEGWTLEEFNEGAAGKNVDIFWNEVRIVEETGQVRHNHTSKPYVMTNYNKALATYKVPSNWKWLEGDALPFDVAEWQARMDWATYVTLTCRQGNHTECNHRIYETEHYCNCSCHTVVK